MHRVAVKDVTLCDGTRIPRGTVVAAAADAMHHDEAVLKNARTFDAFRYARTVEGAGPRSLKLKHQFAHTSPEYIVFGYGPHAWCVSRSRIGIGISDWRSLPFVHKLQELRHERLLFTYDFCSPGRFFAANELKTMMAHLVLHYDVKFAQEGQRPPNVRFGPADLPSHSAKVLFRRRKSVSGVGMGQGGC